MVIKLHRMIALRTLAKPCGAAIEIMDQREWIAISKRYDGGSAVCTVHLMRTHQYRPARGWLVNAKEDGGSHPPFLDAPYDRGMDGTRGSEVYPMSRTILNFRG